jgi:hypothetical protein
MEAIDIHNSMQNAFVQDWLCAFMKPIEDKLMKDEKGGFIGGDAEKDQLIREYGDFEGVIESIQGLYNHEDHEARKNAVATGGDLEATLRVLGKLIEIVGPEHKISEDLNMAYAFVNACIHHAKLEELNAED